MTGWVAGSAERSRPTPVPCATICALSSGPDFRRNAIELWPGRRYVNCVAFERQHGRREPQLPPGGMPPRAIVRPLPSYTQSS